MASVWRHPQSRFFTAIYRDETGRWRRCSTKCEFERSARRIAQAHEERSRWVRQQHQAEAAFLEEVERQRRRLFGDRQQRSAREFCQDWLRTKTVEKADATAARYRGSVKRFLKFLGPQADLPLRGVAPADCQRFYDSLVTERLAPATRVVELKTIRSLFAAARREQLITWNPVEAVVLPSRIRQVQRKVFTPTQVTLLLGEADAEWRTAILLGYYGGLRLGDAISRRWEEFDFVQHCFTFRQTKTGELLTVPLHPALEEHLCGIAGDAAGRLCPTLAGVAVSGRSGLSKQFLALMRKVGIGSDATETGGQRKLAALSFHSLRKTFNSQLHNLGVSQEVRKKLTGHRSDAVNDRYTVTELATLRGAVLQVARL